MACYLKQSTAAEIALGPFLDDTDGKTAETGLSIAQADVRLKKNNGNWGQKNQSSSATHEENGWYEVPLDTTDTNTLGILVVSVSKSGALPVWREFMVVPANVYDSMVGGSDNLQVDAVQIEGSDATDQINAACDTALADYDAPTKAEMDARTLASADYATASALTTVDSVADGIKAVTDNLPDAGALTSLATASALATVDSNVDAILVDTGTTIPGLIAALNDLSASETGDAVLDEVVEGSTTMRQLLRGFAAALLGKASGLDTTSVAYRDLADTKDRIAATVDADGNRASVTLDLT